MMNLQTHRHGEKGVTLIEMLIVIGIIGLISLVSVPAFMSYRQSSRIKSSLRQMTSEIRGTRQRAITRARPVKIAYTEGLASHEYRVFDGSLASPPVWTQVGSERRVDGFVYFDTSSTFVDDQPGFADADSYIDVVFRPDGTVVLPTGVTSAGVILRTSANIPYNQYTITVNPAGTLSTTRSRFN